MRTLKFLLAFQFACAFAATAQEVINLYPGAIPNSKDSQVRESQSTSPPGMFLGVTKPTLEIFLPEKGESTGAAVIICPGGSYKVVVYEAEGIRTAKEFAGKGIAAFVL
ncbi:MAG: alpha/beta hydrolase, partial [Bacteroidota bacterium]